MEKTRKTTPGHPAAKLPKDTPKQGAPTQRPPILDGPVSVKGKVTLPEPTLSKAGLLAALERAKKVDLDKIAGFASSIGNTDIEKTHKGRVTAWDDFIAYLNGDSKALD